MIHVKGIILSMLLIGKCCANTVEVTDRVLSTKIYTGQATVPELIKFCEKSAGAPLLSDDLLPILKIEDINEDEETTYNVQVTSKGRFWKKLSHQKDGYIIRYKKVPKSIFGLLSYEYSKKKDTINFESRSPKHTIVVEKLSS